MMIQAGLAAGEVRFARQVALAWLAIYPGDLPVACLHAEALLSEASQLPASRRGRGYDSPIALFQSICQADPEFLQAQEGLARTLVEARSAARHVQAKNGPVQPAGGDAPTLSRSELDHFGDVLALGGALRPGTPVPEWSHRLHQARQALDSLEASAAWRAKGLPHSPRSEVRGAGERGADLVQAALLGNPTTPLAAVTHLRMLIRGELPRLAIRSLAEMYHQRWPACIQFSLYLANSFMDSGEREKAVALLHQAVSADVTGQVVCRLWGENHPYRVLWPDQLEAVILQELSIPAAVSAALGWNRLPASIPVPSVSSSMSVPTAASVGKTPARMSPDASQKSALAGDSCTIEQVSSARTFVQSEQVPILEVPLSLQSELDQIAGRIKQPQLGRFDGRFPIYVIFTTRQGLQAQYGNDSARLVEEGMLCLAEAVRQRSGWGAAVFYADEGRVLPNSGALASLAEHAARHNDAWSLKLALADLDAALGKQGEMIGALLIVGGPEIIPFHHLPNPVDDADADVPSDNPYATRDENYFIPEWPVGRLPGGDGPDPSLLLHTLSDFTARHLEEARRRPFYWRWWEVLWNSMPIPLGHFASIFPGLKRPGLGYTAAVWEKASQSVFRPASSGQAMLVSPPVQAAPAGAARNGNRHAGLRLPSARLGYFNLHGLSDAAEWYGQRDPAGPDGGPDYPVALRTQDLANGLPEVVFTEACYGAHILGKGVNDALALKFLETGVQAFVGATCIAYGAISDPLTAADLLGYGFWKYLRQGLPAGEAMRRAKIHLAREMHRRQGYLDGEDQKTLISYVLYGDPLAQPLRLGRGPKGTFRPVSPPAQPKTVCDRVEAGGSRPVPPEVLRYVKNVVAEYLPGMTDAQASLSQEHAACGGAGHRCPTSQMGAKGRPAHEPHRQVVTLQKTVPADPTQNLSGSGHLHRHYARLTLDERGKLVKLVVSR